MVVAAAEDPQIVWWSRRWLVVLSLSAISAVIGYYAVTGEYATGRSRLQVCLASMGGAALSYMYWLWGPDGWEKAMEDQADEGWTAALEQLRLENEQLKWDLAQRPPGGGLSPVPHGLPPMPPPQMPPPPMGAGLSAPPQMPPDVAALFRASHAGVNPPPGLAPGGALAAPAAALPPAAAAVEHRPSMVETGATPGEVKTLLELLAAGARADPWWGQRFWQQVAAWQQHRGLAPGLLELLTAHGYIGAATRAAPRADALSADLVRLTAQAAAAAR